MRRTSAVRSRRARALVALFLAATASLVPATALACWDGYSAQVGNVTISRGTGYASWSQDHARFATRWAARIQALLPKGVELDVSDGYLDCRGAVACAGLGTGAGSEDPAKVFGRVADAFGVSAQARRAALATAQPVYTVQLFAGSKKAALRLRDRVNAMSADRQLDRVTSVTFFEEGGFPADNPPAHAVADEKDPTLVRVVFEEYPTLETARAAERALRKEGFGAVVKPLPNGRALDERVSTNAG